MKTPEVKPTACDRLRAYENLILPNAHRVSGQIDRGHDSAFSKLDAATRNKFEALDRLVAAEDALAAARLELATLKREALPAS